MPNWSGSTLTTKGLALQAKVDAGETTLTLTKMKIGSGTLSTGASIEDLTDLISGQLDVTISDISAADNITTVTGVITNASVTTGFYITELGLFATDTDATEILYSMITDGSPDYFPAASGDVTVSEEFAYNLVVSNASSVTATIDQTGLITAAILAAHKEATPIDHPDSSVTDAKIGNREIDDTVEAASGAGVLTNLLSKIGNMIKSITGKSSWYTAPDVSLAEVLPLAGGTITGDLVVEGTTTFDSYYSSIVNICCEEYHSVPVLTAENKSTKVYRKLFTLPATTTGIRGDVLLKMSLAGIEASQGRGYVDLLVSSRGSLLSVGKIFGTIANVDIEIYLNSNSTYSVYATGYGYVASTFSSIMSTHNNVTWDFKTSEETTTTPDGTLEYTLSSASNTAILSVAGKLTVPSLEVDGTTTLDGTLAVAGNVGIGTSATPPRDAVTGRHYLTIKGSTGLGALELTSAASDADAVQIGHIAFVDSNCSVTENGIAFVTAYLDGDTSNNRGGALAFSTKADNATTISERMRITADGYVGVITTSPTAALDLPASTTSRASLRVRAGTAPTSPNAGDLYNNGSSLYFYNGSTAYNLCNSSVGTGSIRGL
ncbi:MAG: hypothetical protein H6Q73_3470, partial [Firmicutes bacterium]|nr:hypothetical protein [Bacillota bacterium]